MTMNRCPKHGPYDFPGDCPFCHPRQRQAPIDVTCTCCNEPCTESERDDQGHCAGCTDRFGNLKQEDGMSDHLVIADWLLPCPHCESPMGRGPEETHVCHMHDDDDMRSWWIVQCGNCEAQTGEYETMAEAIEAWNRRASDDEAEEHEDREEEDDE
jgi:hypothetical protein